MITVRAFQSAAAEPIAELLNPIIADGTTTALTGQVTGADILDWSQNRRRPAWHVAVNEEDTLLGFQWINQLDDDTPEAADIATFVKVGQTGLGIGSKLFEATKVAARELGFQWINANIRSDNESGLTYYSARGFYDYGTIFGYTLTDGRVVNKTLKRFDL